MKNMLAVIGLFFIAFVIILFRVDSPREVVYDCGMAEWHPDIPASVKEECRRIRIEEWKNKMQKNTETKSWIVTIKEDPDTKELILPFTPDMLSQVGWDFGDTLVWEDNKDGSWSLTKKSV
jgi:hypothetical protein